LLLPDGVKSYGSLAASISLMASSAHCSAHFFPSLKPSKAKFNLLGFLII